MLPFSEGALCPHNHVTNKGLSFAPRTGAVFFWANEGQSGKVEIERGRQLKRLSKNPEQRPSPDRSGILEIRMVKTEQFHFSKRSYTPSAPMTIAN
jgi:hypothetical protein